MMKHLVIERLRSARLRLACEAKGLRGRTTSYAKSCATFYSTFYAKRYAAATLTAFTLLFGAVAAQADRINVARTPHPRHVAATQDVQPSGAHSNVRSSARSNVRLGAKAAAPRRTHTVEAKAAAKRSPVRPVRRAIAEKQAAPVVTAHARNRHNRAEEQPEPIEMHRASLRRERRRATGREARPEMAERQAMPAPIAAVASDHELTSADFLNATVASSPVLSSPVASSPVASGVVAGSTVARNTSSVTAKHTTPMAHVESNGPLAVRPATAEDLAPMPDEFAYLAHPTHQELSEEVAIPMVLPGLYRNGRLIVPAPLKGTHEILVHQNLMADDEGLERIQDDEDLARLRASHQLINFPESASLRVNPELSAGRRCARVWTVRFAADIARQYYARFGQPLQVNSAARTIAYQVRLQRVNGNAAGIGGDVASPHLTGQAIDFGKSGMSIAEIAWMRAYLKPLMDTGKLDVEEEFQQACFHISVYRSYMPAVTKRPKTELATLHGPKTAVRLDRDE